MNISESILGFIDFCNDTFPFSYNDGVLNLFPANANKKHEMIDEQYERMFETKDNDKWIDHIDLEGVAHNGQCVLFRVSGNYSTDNGFIYFDVILYVLYDSNYLNLSMIKGMYLSGDVIDYFVPPHQIFESSVNLKGDSDRRRKIRVKCESEVIKNFGKYKYLDNEIKLAVNIYPSIRFGSAQPLSSQSELVVTFEQQVNINVIFDTYLNLLRFFQFICYRKNVEVKKIELFVIDNKRQRRCGYLFVMPRDEFTKETNINRSKMIITGEILGEKASQLLECISNKDMYFNHLNTSINEMKTYHVDRQILIFSAFEREFRNIYGDNYKRSDEYIEARNSIVEIIDAYKRENTGNKKKYINEIRRSVLKLDSSLSDRINAAIDDCCAILKPFVRHLYKQDVATVKSDISRRMNQFRNDIVHANLIPYLSPIHLKDFKVLEMLYYIMRLKYIGIAIIDIQKSIAVLFRIPMSFSSK